MAELTERGSDVTAPMKDGEKVDRIVGILEKRLTEFGQAVYRQLKDSSHLIYAANFFCYYIHCPVLRARVPRAPILYLN